MGLAILLALALQAAPDAATKTYEVEFLPLTPSERQYAHLGPAGPYYPDRAFRNGQNGEGQLRCIAAPRGELQECEPVAERPDGSGFSLAARLLADRKRIRAAGSPPVGEAIHVRVPFVIGAPVRAIERVARTQTIKVAAPDVRGHAEVACVVTEAGPDYCYVLFFQSSTRASSATTAAAALLAVGQVPADALPKNGWVIIPVDVRPTP